MKPHLDSAETQLQIDLQLHEYIVLAERLLIDLINAFGSQCQSQFNSTQIPSISLQSYMRRIHKIAGFSSQALIIAVLYIDRYNMANEQFSLNWHNVHRLLLSCLLLAAKFHDDVFFDNITYQKAGGVSKEALLEFQLQVFRGIGYNAFVKQEEFQDLVQKLYSVYGQAQSGTEDGNENGIQQKIHN